MKTFSSFKRTAESKFYCLFGGFHNDIWWLPYIFVESTVQGTELIDIEFYIKYFHFTDEVPFYCFKKINQ